MPSRQQLTPEQLASPEHDSGDNMAPDEAIVKFQRDLDKLKEAGWDPGGVAHAAGLMDTRVYELNCERQREIKGRGREIAMLVQFIRTSLIATFGREIPKEALDRVTSAIGTIENYISPEQKQKIKEEYDLMLVLAHGARENTYNDTFKKTGSEALASEDADAIYAARVAQADADRIEAINDLETVAVQRFINERDEALQWIRENLKGGEELASEMVKIRGIMDTLSEQIAEIIAPKSKPTKGASIEQVDAYHHNLNIALALYRRLGVHLHRSYMLSDPDKRDSYLALLAGSDPQIAEVKRRAYVMLLNDEIKNHVKNRRQGGMTPEEAAQSARNNMGSLKDKAQETMVRLMGMGQSRSLDYFVIPKQGFKDIRILKERAVVPEEIQDLWGVCRDPMINLSKSFMLLTQYMASHKFMEGVKDIGLKEGWLRPEKGIPSDGQKWMPIMGPNVHDPKFDPLGGYWAPKEIAVVFRPMLGLPPQDGVSGSGCRDVQASM